MIKFNILKEEEAKIWKIYNGLRYSEGVYCPVFKCKIKFTLMGWKHIIGATGHKKRTSKEKLRKLKLFNYVVDIIKKSSTFQDIREARSHIDYCLESVLKIKYKNVREYSKVRVIIREDKKGIKKFYSVMDKRISQKKRGTSRFGKRR